MAIVPWRKREGAARNNWDDLPTIFNRLFENRLFEQLPQAFAGGHVPVNIAEDEQHYTIQAELPGMNEKDINVQLMGNQLIISGEKRFEEEKQGKEYHRIESMYGSFTRTITLPSEVRGDEVKASYKNGVLTITVPKEAPTPAAKIEVKAG